MATSPTDRLRRLTAGTTSGMLLVGTPVLLDYVVRPGDTLSEIAQRHDTSVSRIVAENDLHPSGDRLTSGQILEIPAAHGRGSGDSADPAAGSTDGSTDGSTAAPSADARRIVHYTVKPGDTPSGLAVRFHAWTAELVELNGSTLRAGERIRIPVVVAAAAKAEAGAHDGAAADRRAERRDTPSRTRVRRIIERTARDWGVDPHLALAVSWQEAGWQQHHVSSADAVGAMQVVPATGTWMSGVVGRPLELSDVRDNVTAGVALLKILTDVAPERRAVAGYYQGLAGVRKHGMYDDTRRYVANVLSLKRRFARGDYPA